MFVGNIAYEATGKDRFICPAFMKALFLFFCSGFGSLEALAFKQTR